MNTYLIYGITDCPACLRACADLKDKYQWPTFPIIVRQFNDITMKIGGYNQLKEYMKNPGALS